MPSRPKIWSEVFILFRDIDEVRTTPDFLFVGGWGGGRRGWLAQTRPPGTATDFFFLDEVDGLVIVGGKTFWVCHRLFV